MFKHFYNIKKEVLVNMIKKCESLFKQQKKNYRQKFNQMEEKFLLKRDFQSLILLLVFK